MTEQEFRQVLAAQQFADPVAIERDHGYALDVHEHPFEAFALILDGEITLEVADVTTTYRPGDTFRLAAHTPHRESVGASGVRYLSGRKEAT
jgi:quercetin dioxygenase-like cupin family protein